MAYIGTKPADKTLTAADITDSIITSAKIVDATITNSDVASSIITGQTAETSIAGGDSVLIYDDSASALRKMTRTNFVAGIGATAGQVIQVVSTTKTDKFSLAVTSTFTDITGFSVSITPASASNKILITGHISGGHDQGRVAFRLMRDSTAIGVGDSAGSRQQSTVGATALQSNDHLNASFNFLDSPSSTSSITYKVQMITESSATINSSHGDANTNAPPMTRSISTITVMEIKG